MINWYYRVLYRSSRVGIRIKIQDSLFKSPVLLSCFQSLECARLTAKKPRDKLWRPMWGVRSDWDSNGQQRRSAAWPEAVCTSLLTEHHFRVTGRLCSTEADVARVVARAIVRDVRAEINTNYRALYRARTTVVKTILTFINIYCIIGLMWSCTWSIEKPQDWWTDAVQAGRWTVFETPCPDAEGTEPRLTDRGQLGPTAAAMVLWVKDNYLPASLRASRGTVILIKGCGRTFVVVWIVVPAGERVELMT